MRRWHYFVLFFLAGFQGFTDYRCFHVCKKAVTFEGVTKEVGVVECKPDAASPTWGDTTGEHGMPVFKYLTHALLTVISFHSFGCAGTFLPLMVDPHKVLDYDNWWNKSLGNIKPYQIPPLSQEVLTKLHNQLDASSDRIWRTRPAEEATKIVALLRDLINSHTETQTYKFSWNLSLYRNPPKQANKVANKHVCYSSFQSFVFTTHFFFFN